MHRGALRPVHISRPASQNVPRRWNKIFHFGSSECCYWRASDKFRGYLSTVLSSLFRHGCSSRWSVPVYRQEHQLSTDLFLGKTLISWEDEKKWGRVWEYLMPCFTLNHSRGRNLKYTADYNPYTVKPTISQSPDQVRDLDRTAKSIRMNIQSLMCLALVN